MNATFPKPKKSLPLGIEKLIVDTTKAAEQTKRLSRETVSFLLAALCNEIAYASQIIPITLTDNLVSDAPHHPANLELNEVVINLIKTLLNPSQKDVIANLIHSYRYDRKKTEKEYAAFLLEDVLNETNIKSLPTSIQMALRDFTQTIIEKIINEKQLRTLPNYRLQALIEIVEYFIYQRSPNIEIERFKVTQPFAFRKFVNTVSHASYERITDTKKLALIQKEKTFAFNTFKKAISSKTPLPKDLKILEENLKILQKSQNEQYLLLKKQLDAIFKFTNKRNLRNELIQQLHGRFNDKLRRTLKTFEINPDIYINEETIKKTHTQALLETEKDIKAIQDLITLVFSISDNYSKKLTQVLAQRKTIENIESILCDTVLGKNTTRFDPITAQAQIVRLGGYPQKNAVEIYTSIIKSLSALQANITGFFSAALKVEIQQVLTKLTTISKDLVVPVPQSHIKRPAEPIAPAMPTEEQTEELLKLFVEANTKKPAPAPSETKSEITKEPQPEPEPITPGPAILDEIFNEELEPIIFEPEKSTSNKVEPKPLLINETFDDEPIIEKVTPPPLAVDETFEDESVPTIQLEPVVKVESQSISESNKVAQPANSQIESPAQAAIDTGSQIMKNYQLGDFEPFIVAAWQRMTTGGAGSDNEVRLYVICDLAQQISSVNSAALDEEQKSALQKIKTQVIDALNDPLDENNWDYFEGTQRIYIDGTLTALGI